MTNCLLNQLILIDMTFDKIRVHVLTCTSKLTKVITKAHKLFYVRKNGLYHFISQKIIIATKSRKSDNNKCHFFYFRHERI